jgi:Flp pilus assembly protein TadB
MREGWPFGPVNKTVWSQFQARRSKQMGHRSHHQSNRHEFATGFLLIAGFLALIFWPLAILFAILVSIMAGISFAIGYFRTKRYGER